MIGKAIIPRTEGMKEYIDYYNNKRIKGKLKGMSPVTIQSSFPSSLVPNQKMSNFGGSVQIYLLYILSLFYYWRNKILNGIS